MPRLERWELWFKACSAADAVASTLGLIAGLYTCHQQSVAANALKEKELRLLQYNQKKEVYYELSDAAAAVATSRTKQDALKIAAKISTLYFGRAHIFAIDPAVNSDKISFYSKMQGALKKGTFPSDDLEFAALSLTNACREVLRVQDIFSGKSPT